MNTGLSSATNQTLVSLGSAFDWHAYTQKVWPEADTVTLHAKMGEEIKDLQTSSKLRVVVERNFALNSYLHRNFHHWGYLPAAYTEWWYDMLFLYLHLYRLPVPVTYRHALYTSWVGRPKGAAEAAAAEIRQALKRKQLVN